MEKVSVHSVSIHFEQETFNCTFIEKLFIAQDNTKYKTESEMEKEEKKQIKKDKRHRMIREREREREVGR